MNTNKMISVIICYHVTPAITCKDNIADTEYTTCMNNNYLYIDKSLQLQKVEMIKIVRLV